MSWSAHLQHTESGLALTFASPISRLDMAPDVAQHLASLLAVEARQRMTGVVRALVGDRQDGAAECVSPENKPVEVIGDVHPLCCNCDTCLNGHTMPNKILRLHVFEGAKQSIIDELLRLQVPGGAAKIGTQETIRQTILDDPRWRREYVLTLPDDVDTLNVLAAIEFDDRIKVLENRDA